MDSKVCVICDTEKSIDNSYNKYSECKQCNIKRSMKRFYEIKDKLSNQRKLYYEKNTDVLLAKSKLNQKIGTNKEKYINSKQKNSIKH